MNFGGIDSWSKFSIYFEVNVARFVVVVTAEIVVVVDDVVPDMVIWKHIWLCSLHHYNVTLTWYVTYNAFSYSNHNNHNHNL